jgi:hypothetical protein
MVRPDSHKMRVAISFVGIGKPSINQLRPLYAHPDPAVAYHAAYAGLRLNDHLALETMLAITRDPDHPLRVPAILSLGEPHRYMGIGPQLRPLLSQDDQLVRVAAYETLTALADESITSEWVGLDRLGFRLDVVDSTGPFLIFVTRTEQPRIVMFGGEGLELMRPLFLRSERTGVTLNARVGDRYLQVMRRDPKTGGLMQVGTRVVKATTQPADQRGAPEPGPRLPEEPEGLRVNPDGDEVRDPSIDPETGLPVTREVPVYVYKNSFRAVDLVRALGRSPYRSPAGSLQGFGLNYSQVVHVLHQLNKSGQMPARIYLQPLPPSNRKLDEEEAIVSRSDVQPRSERPAPTGDARTPPAEGPPPATSQPEDLQRLVKPPDIVIERPGTPPTMGD